MVAGNDYGQKDDLKKITGMYPRERLREGRGDARKRYPSKTSG